MVPFLNLSSGPFVNDSRPSKTKKKNYSSIIQSIEDATAIRVERKPTTTPTQKQQSFWLFTFTSITFLIAVSRQPHSFPFIHWLTHSFTTISLSNWSRSTPRTIFKLNQMDLVKYQSVNGQHSLESNALDKVFKEILQLVHSLVLFIESVLSVVVVGCLKIQIVIQIFRWNKCKCFVKIPFNASILLARVDAVVSIRLPLFCIGCYPVEMMANSQRKKITAIQIKNRQVFFIFEQFLKVCYDLVSMPSTNPRNRVIDEWKHVRFCFHCWCREKSHHFFYLLWKSSEKWEDFAIVRIMWH